MLGRHICGMGSWFNIRNPFPEKCGKGIIPLSVGRSIALAFRL